MSGILKNIPFPYFSLVWRHKFLSPWWRFPSELVPWDRFHTKNDIHICQDSSETYLYQFLALFIYFVICHIDDITTEPESDTDNEVKD